MKYLYTSIIAIMVMSCSKSRPAAIVLRMQGERYQLYTGFMKTRFSFHFTQSNFDYTPHDSTNVAIAWEGSVYGIVIPANESFGYLIPRGTMAAAPQVANRILSVTNQSIHISF